MKIRSTKLSDYQQIEQLLRQVKMTGRWFTKRLFAKALKHNKGFYIVAVENNKIIGNVFVFHDGDKYAYISKLAVTPTMWRRGIAKKLIQTVVKRLKKRGNNWIYCLISKKNKASIKVFTSIGFKVRKSYYLVDNF